MNPNPTASTELAALAERFWQFQRREFPLNAFIAGQGNSDPTMFREAPADTERRAGEAKLMRAELDRIAPQQLTATERTSQRMLARELDDLQSAAATLSHLKPWLLPLGPEFNTVYFANQVHLSNAAAAELYVERLATLPAYVADVQACLREGLKRGIRHPRPVLAAALPNFRATVPTAAEGSPWLGPFKRSPALSQPAVQRAAERASVVIEQQLAPALAALADTAEHECLPAARDTLSCREDPQGEAFYDFWTRHFTTDDSATPEAIHALGLSEVARLEAALEQVADEAGYAGALPRYRDFLAHDPQFRAASAEALRERCEVVCKRIDGLLPAWFGNLPRISYGVQSMPAATSARMPPAYAQPNPADRSMPGVFWVSSLPEKCPMYMHVPLALHEGFPGHLMHMALMQEDTALPAFRRAGFNKYSAFLEGWALYCETLGVEMGLYRTPHEHAGRLEMELWRACRLAVDTGIHAHGWSRERAISFMAERLAMARVTIEAEVDRYIAMPAQALGYQIGNLKFRALRAEAQTKLADRFDVRAFHDRLMAAGPVTLPVLDEWVGAWVEEKLAA